MQLAAGTPIEEFLLSQKQTAMDESNTLQVAAVLIHASAND